MSRWSTYSRPYCHSTGMVTTSRVEIPEPTIYLCNQLRLICIQHDIQDSSSLSDYCTSANTLSSRQSQFILVKKGQNIKFIYTYKIHHSYIRARSSLDRYSAGFGNFVLAFGQYDVTCAHFPSFPMWCHYQMLAQTWTQPSSSPYYFRLVFWQGFQNRSNHARRPGTRLSISYTVLHPLVFNIIDSQSSHICRSVLICLLFQTRLIKYLYV